MGAKSRVALCLFGQMRTYKETYDFLYENVIEEFDPDIFIHTWKEVGGTWKESGSINSGEVSEDELEQLYSPESVVIEEFQQEYYERLGDVEVPEKVKRLDTFKKGAIPMFYKTYKVNELKREAEIERGSTYDIVILVRPDLIILEKLTAEIVENTDIFWCGPKTGNPYLLHDQYLISNSKNMDYYASIWKKLNEYWETELHGKYKKMGEPCGEFDIDGVNIGRPTRLIHYHFETSDIPVKEHDLRAKIIRHGTDTRYFKQGKLGKIKHIYNNGGSDIRWSTGPLLSGLIILREDGLGKLYRRSKEYISERLS